MKPIFIKPLTRAIALLVMSVAGIAGAQIQESPLDTQILPIGQMFSLIIKGDGESNPPARITAEGLPPESVFLRNLDGSRTFMWIPDDGDKGTSSFLVTIADGSDATLSATYPINLEVVDPAGSAKAVTAANTAEPTIDELRPANTNSAAPVAGAAQLHSAEVAVSYTHLTLPTKA